MQPSSIKPRLEAPKKEVCTVADTEHWFSKIATKTETGSGRPWAFGVAAGFVVGWLVSGPLFHFSDTWQLVMNTLSSIVTFLMVFLIQRSQNKASLAMQIKLNEIVAGLKGASNRIIDIEDLDE